MLKYFTIILFALMSMCFTVNPWDEATSNYVDAYKDLAIIEMHRSGIPASITLAQALHESQIGGSDLAIYANNHFGIKCKSYWRGKTYQHKDDDYDAQGNLIQSCFRSYDSVIDSYIDHTNFLTQSAHYSELFEYDKTDYFKWAHGLKKCGYATDPEYAFKLIDKIEKYQLYIYDTSSNPMKAE
jgi:flagellum-specific peptidoglycan hydrolase FlgJ